VLLAWQSWSIPIVGQSDLDGSLIEAHNIYKDIRRWADVNGVKIVTFGQEKASGAGYYILSAGMSILICR
jgi:hypothetical protein